MSYHDKIRRDINNKLIEMLTCYLNIFLCVENILAFAMF